MPTPVSPIRITVYIFFQLAFSIIRYRRLKKQIVYINISLSDVRPFCTNLTNIQRNKMTATVSSQVNPSSLAPATDPFPFWEFVVGFCRLRFNKRLLASPSSPLENYLGFSPLFLCAAYELSEEDYYLCAMYGPGSQFYKKQWQQTLDPTVRWIAYARARCLILVWGILISWAVTSVVVVSLYRCYSTDQKAKIQKQAIWQTVNAFGLYWVRCLSIWRKISEFLLLAWLGYLLFRHCTEDVRPLSVGL